MATKLHGLDGVMRRFNTLTDPKRMLAVNRGAARAAANIMRDAARANAARVDDPATPENIRKNITTRKAPVRVERKEGGTMMRVGVLGGARDMSKYGEFKGKGKGNPGGDTWYWRFLEFGTVKMKAQPFMRPAIATTITPMIEKYAAELDKRITKELNKK